ncbi:DoxX family protein [Brevibacillus nitrificans]|uniref:DoxX family protein n=1 Tax=Brevibacillus nitrificans TaxID=651560 RepID=A0A3M8D4K3_9BACL|nr:DoxX family protein [Brevibacillus nitrificans]RNB82962.1 DoxX family protein [Brevibacillus nitrificans]
MDILILLGRVLFAFIFVAAGFAHLKDFQHTKEMAQKSKAPFPAMSAAIMVILAILGGLSVALGLYAKIGALLLVLFLLPTTFIVHRFWGLTDPMQVAMQRIQFNKNLALLGASLLLAYYGSGPYSLLS